MSVSYDITSTLRSQTKHHEPVVLVLNCQGGANEIVTKDKTATLTAALYSSGNNKMVLVYDARGNGGGQNRTDNYRRPHGTHKRLYGGSGAE